MRKHFLQRVTMKSHRAFFTMSEGFTMISLRTQSHKLISISIYEIYDNCKTQLQKPFCTL